MVNNLTVDQKTHTSSSYILKTNENSFSSLGPKFLRSHDQQSQLTNSSIQSVLWGSVTHTQRHVCTNKRFTLFVQFTSNNSFFSDRLNGCPCLCVHCILVSYFSSSTQPCFWTEWLLLVQNTTDVLFLFRSNDFTFACHLQHVCLLLF